MRLIKSGKVTDGTNTAIASSGMGVAVLKGAPKPDISTPEAFKRALLAAKAVAYTDPASGGASGAHMAKVLERLGIANEINAKAKLGANMPVAKFVVAGEAEIAIQQMPELMHVEGVDVDRPPARRPAEHHDLRGRNTVGLRAGRRRQGAGALPANAGIGCRDQEARPRSRSAGRAAESLVGLSRLPRTAECGRPPVAHDRLLRV